MQSPTHRGVHRSISASSTKPSRRASSGAETLREYTNARTKERGSEMRERERAANAAGVSQKRNNQHQTQIFAYILFSVLFFFLGLRLFLVSLATGNYDYTQRHTRRNQTFRESHERACVVLCGVPVLFSVFVSILFTISYAIYVFVFFFCVYVCVFFPSGVSSTTTHTISFRPTPPDEHKHAHKMAITCIFILLFSRNPPIPIIISWHPTNTDTKIPQHPDTKRRKTTMTKTKKNKKKTTSVLSI